MPRGYDRRDMRERLRDRARGRMMDRRYDWARGRGGRDFERMMEEYDRRGDYARGGRGGSQGGRGGSQGGRRGGQSDREYSDRRGRDMRYDDYEDPRDFEYNSDNAEEEMELTPEDLKEWGKKLKNIDNSKGPKFDKNQIIPLARQHDIEFKEDEFTEDEFVLAVNVVYSDYAEALQKSGLATYNRPEPYIHLAKAWLCDPDFEGKPYEKLALYYYTIVGYDD